MAPKNKPVVEEPVEEVLEETSNDEVEVVQEPVIEEPIKEPEPQVCGHVNRHSYGTDGKLQPLSCDLAPKHEGDHHARHIRNVKDEPETDAKGRVVKQTYHTEEAETWWKDAAGKPAHLIPEGEIGQMSLLQKDLVMQILNKNPKMPVADAVKQAKSNPAWNAAELS
jgi:hypothetical protein